ncbi:hypothetical protein [Pseudovibrio flavus]|uniref:hypothetical protein n=1 Tax=Pseudovibrio flavus TaxID=2529854 RepID=UPI00211C3C5F|nr:hypothetical protein [Pseudovibrio flavus]
MDDMQAMSFGEMGMGVWQIVMILAWIIIVGIPIAQILGRMGFSKLWTIVAFIPFVNLIALWVVAFARWPRD